MAQSLCKLYLNLADSLILKSYFFKRKLFSKSKADLNKGIKYSPNYEGEFSQIIFKTDFCRKYFLFIIDQGYYYKKIISMNLLFVLLLFPEKLCKFG